MLGLRKALWCSAAGALLVGSIGPAASAQTLQGALAESARSNFARDRNVSVRERPHPEYQAPVHQAGAFTIAPTLALAAEYNDNIFATPLGHVDDFIGRATPRVDIASTWSRHALSAFAQTTVNRYASTDNQDTTDWQLGAAGRLDASRTTNLVGSIDTGKFTEPRTSATTQNLSKDPIRFRQSNGFLTGSHEFNRLRLLARGDWRKFNYIDGVSATGAKVEQDDRDRTFTALQGRADYAVSPDTALFVSATANWRDYRLKRPTVPIDRTSNGYELLAGANFEISNLIRGEFGAGYLKQRYDDPGFGDISGFGARGQVEWFPSQITTVTFTGSRSVEDAALVGSSGFVSSNLGAQVDHELLRNIIITGQANWGRDAFRGIDRQDRRLTVGASASYLMNRRLGFTLGYSHFDQNSRGKNAGFNYDVDRVILTLNGHF